MPTCHKRPGRCPLHSFLRFFFSPGWHKWQNAHSTPEVHPGPSLKTKAQGLQVPKRCFREPTVGSSSEPKIPISALLNAGSASVSTVEQALLCTTSGSESASTSESRDAGGVRKGEVRPGGGAKPGGGENGGNVCCLCPGLTKERAVWHTIVQVAFSTPICKERVALR